MSLERNEGVSDQAAERLRVMTARLTRARGVRHSLVAVGTGQGETLWVGAAGSADGGASPMTPDTPYLLASVTKLYIATVVLRLHEEGLVDLDAPMAHYLPDEMVRQLHHRKGSDRTGQITVRHLLGHASGLPEYLVLARKRERSLVDGVVDHPDRAWGIEEIVALVRDCGQPHYPPRPLDGKRHTIRYSDTNFQLLIAIIERVLGRPLHEALGALIFEPLGLVRTFLPGTPPALNSPRPAAVWMGDERLDDKPGPMRSFRDLVSTAEETIRFMAALVDGRVFDDPSTARLMTGHFNPFAFSPTLRPLGPGWPIEYGLGMLRFRLPRVFTGFRQSPWLYGHTGATGSWLFHEPTADLILSGTVDQVTSAPVPYQFVPRLVRELESLGIRGSDAA